MGARNAPRRTLIRGGTVVAHTGSATADVLVDGERIAGIGDFDPEDADAIVDASGRLVIPGAIDVHTHLDMAVGAVRSSDDFASGTAAAACGGAATILDFATAHRGQSPRDALAAWPTKAYGQAMVDYGFHMSLTELAAPADAIVAEMVEAGFTRFKV